MALNHRATAFGVGDGHLDASLSTD